jgi:soluble lytic murein transglycosylase-like protein
MKLATESVAQARLRRRTMMCLILIVGMPMTMPASAQSVGDWQPFVAEASVRFAVPADWINRVMMAESQGRTIFAGRPITSSKGAMGLMQLMPLTWSTMRATLHLGSDPYDPHDNIIAGTAYLRILYDRFGYPGVFAAYNAGPTRYAAYRGTARALPAETRAYVMTTAGTAIKPRKSGASPTGGGMFVALSRAVRSGDGDHAAEPVPDMFVTLSQR